MFVLITANLALVAYVFLGALSPKTGPEPAVSVTNKLTNLQLDVIGTNPPPSR